ncbi:MAG TPA: DNA-formamidopyrimidine glycosylase family protein, partial [Candidatus Limnocylindria bacterium]|nr:DNA-formamidopyrimidine glycosylase family protein [Candidatus Limnocylindria bacterium]
MWRARRRKRPSPSRSRPSDVPELPEVETVARDLQRWVAGARITDAEVRWS